MSKLKEVLGKYECNKVLDVGTGRGEFTQILIDYLKSYDEIVCIDYSDRTQALIEEKFKDKNVKFYNMDCAKLEFKEELFDAVSISNALHELSDIQTVLKQMNRVLKKDGIMIFNEMYCDNQSAKQMSHVKLHHFVAKLHRLNGRTHNSTFKKEEILDIIQTLDMRVLDILEHSTHEDQLKASSDNITEERLTDIDDNISRLTNNFKETEYYDELVKEKENLIEYIKDNGLFSATELLVIVKK
ncbi:class I SAM-dependent methyltransferase [Clostridiaceae bacterium M8S5]|nr:class I SAM-dependent methyltransferase [Clostridiaceae bacterium M8S5]